MDWIQSPLAISHYSSKTSSGGEMRTNESLFALTSIVHYQSGEDIVVILCHHPHGLGLQGYKDRVWGRKMGMKRGGRESGHIFRLGHLQSAAQLE